MFNPFAKIYNLYRDERTRRMNERFHVRRRVVRRDTYQAAQAVIAQFGSGAALAAFESGINAKIAGEPVTANFLFGVANYLEEVQRYDDASQYVIKEAGEDGPRDPGYAARTIDELRLQLYAKAHMPELGFGIPFGSPEREAYDEKWRVFEENKPRPFEPQEK